MANNLPTVKSFETIVGDAVASYLSNLSINDLNVGSAVLSFFEAYGQAVYRASGDILGMLSSNSVDRSEGDLLQRIAKDEGLPIIKAKVASGKITITDSNFTKISTKVYAGTSAPNIGSTVINVSDASLFSATGSIYIGRGTAQVEGPLAYASITPVGSFYAINLSTPTSKFHNTQESVILAQGGARIISAGTTVKTAASGSSPIINFTITQSATLLDGEDTITDVPVSCQQPGTDGNVSRGAIKEFASVPFSGALVTNPLPFTTGKNTETDIELKARIKRSRASKGLGTITAVTSSVLNAQPSDENTQITSSEILVDVDKTELIIDNGEGYEEITQGVGQEFLIDSALGGVTHFQLAMGGAQSSIQKASLVSFNSAPFDISTTDRLAILVGGILSEHVFATGDFKSDGFATAYEVVASINGDTTLDFTARTADNGTKVSIVAKEEINEYLQVTTPTSGTDASIALGFPVSEVQTLRLYKNKTALNKNGRSAIISSALQDSWSVTITTGETLVISVDGTANITYTFVDADFIAEGTHTSVDKNNTLASWINVINAKITGVTASINGTQILLSSNLGASTRASLVIDSSSTLVTKGMFTSVFGLSATGSTSDFTLSRNTGQGKLTVPLSDGDSLTAGTEYTKGFIESTPILGGALTLASDAYLWFLIDNQAATTINHGVVGSSVFDFTKEGGGVVRFRSNVTNAFANVAVGDYVIMWSAELSAANRLEGRVCAIGTHTLANDYFELRITAAEYAAASNQAVVIFQEGLAFVRTINPPQKVKIAAAAYDINTIASDLTEDLVGGTVTVEDEEKLVVTTDTVEDFGSVFLITFNDAAKGLNFTLGDSANSITSHFASQESQNASNVFPLFVHSTISDDNSAIPPDSYITDFDSTVNLATLGIYPNEMINFLHPYLTGGSNIEDAQADDESVQIKSITGVTVGINQNEFIKRLRISDRYYLASPLDFDYNDSIVAILDADPSNKTFLIPLYRRAIANTTMAVNATNFRAYDVDSGATETFDTFFGSSFDFSNYKAMMKARNGIDPVSLTDEDAIFYQAAVWGKAGERYNVGYIYPTAPNGDISSTVTISDNLDIRISLKSGAAVPNNIDGTTQWDISVAANTPVAGVEEVTYTWNTVGTNPAMATLVVGNYVTIIAGGAFNPANLGTFRICAATAISFTIRRPNGEAVAENNIATVQSNVISLYEDSNTTATEIVDYVTANLSNYITATLLDDNGITGAGVIDLSTYEDNSFVVGTQGVALLDGINFVYSSDPDAVAPLPNFVFKTSLSLPNFDTNTLGAYEFRDGEEVRLIPTTANQLKEFVSILAISGITTVGDVSSSDRQRSLQLSTQIFGSDGSVQISGGIGNTTVAPILSVSTKVSGTVLMRSNVSKSSAVGLHADEWVNIESENVQKKESGISATTTVTIDPNNPVAGKARITLGSRNAQDLYFGQPRNHVRDRARAFHVEKHGMFACITWDATTGGSPVFSKAVNFNDAGGGDMTVAYSATTGYTSYTVDTGNRLFNEVQPGDVATIINFTDDENNGTFNIIGVSDDGLTIVTDNTDGVTAVAAAVAPGDITIATAISEGDTVVIGAPFTSLNQGTFRVIRRYGDSIYIDNSAAVEERVVVVANLRSLGIDGTTQFDVTVPGDMRITFDGTGTVPTLDNAKMGDIITIGTAFNVANRGNFMITKTAPTYIECANANAVAENDIVVSGAGGDVLEAHQPAMIFTPYENAVAGDDFIISGDVLTTANAGTFTIEEVLNKTEITIVGTMVSQAGVVLSTKYTQVYVQEQTPYVGYKKIYNIAVDPSNSDQSVLLFDSVNQFNKINLSSVSVLSAMSKLNFATAIKSGLDSYRYYTGLIREANKIVYGEPRDPITYPGVAAAGAEIFISSARVRRIQVSINVRLQTGIPFVTIVNQVRNNVAALINASPSGESIAISAIVSTVNSISGVKAVSISSPQYDALHDVIVVNAGEKPLILDAVNDITVSKV
jgi:hypothetical protein